MQNGVNISDVVDSNFKWKLSLFCKGFWCGFSPFHASLLEHTLQQSAIVFVHLCNVWSVCCVFFFLSPFICFPSLMWLFSFSHRCKFFSLTETPENYTVVLDEEGFKGNTHTQTALLILLCSVDDDTHCHGMYWELYHLFVNSVCCNYMLSTFDPGDS